MFEIISKTTFVNGNKLIPDAGSIAKCANNSNHKQPCPPAWPGCSEVRLPYIRPTHGPIADGAVATGSAQWIRRSSTAAHHRFVPAEAVPVEISLSSKSPETAVLRSATKIYIRYVKHNVARKQQEHVYATKSVRTTTTSERETLKQTSLRLANASNEERMGMRGRTGVLPSHAAQRGTGRDGHQIARPSRSNETGSVATMCTSRAQPEGKYEKHG